MQETPYLKLNVYLNFQPIITVFHMLMRTVLARFYTCTVKYSRVIRIHIYRVSQPYVEFRGNDLKKLHDTLQKSNNANIPFKCVPLKSSLMCFINFFKNKVP